MSLVRALIAALNAFAAVYPVLVARSISREIDDFDDEMLNLARSGSAADKLRIELVNKRKRRAIEQLGVIRSSNDHPD